MLLVVAEEFELLGDIPCAICVHGRSQPVERDLVQPQQTESDSEVNQYRGDPSSVAVVTLITRVASLVYAG